MVALKALSNIGIVSENFPDILYLIIEDSIYDPALRIASVEVFRRLPCDSSRLYFEKMFRELSGDAEVRISSYLQMMRCPDYMLIRRIRTYLMNEEINQGWYKLRQIMEMSELERVNFLTMQDVFRIAAFCLIYISRSAYFACFSLCLLIS